MKVTDFLIIENEDWVAFNKLSGLSSIPDRVGKDLSLKTLLRERYGSIFTVHRLDRDTSGLIIFAKNEMSHKFLSQQFENRQTIKIYHGLLMGVPTERTGNI